MVVRKPFGGYSISFKAVSDATLSEVFGTGALTPSEMTKKLWVFIKKKGLSSK
ncbi:MAG: hypothetical protein V1722_02285 [Candidatus Micrarchaeota archaeon]